MALERIGGSAPGGDEMSEKYAAAALKLWVRAGAAEHKTRLARTTVNVLMVVTSRTRST